MYQTLLRIFFLLLIYPAQAQRQEHPGYIKPLGIIQQLSDSELLDVVQRQTFRYFWDFGHPVSGLARERSNITPYHGSEVVTTGGSGFGIMALIVAESRRWITRQQAVERMNRIVDFLYKAESFHGAFPHWMNGETGKALPFSRKDNGADLVETAYLFQGLLCARQYFTGNSASEQHIRDVIGWLWNEMEWNWFTRDGRDVLYWHWSPDNGWSKDFPIRGFNECLITYILAASSENYPVSVDVYHHGWAQSNFFKNGKQFQGITLPLGFDYGGPLFFSQYSFLGLDPRGLTDRYADYWEQNQHHTLINYSYCVANPKGFKGYGENCWGLSSSDNYEGYDAHSPTNDLGVITPTAALSAFPYAPEQSMKALRHFYYDLGRQLWGEYGFTDAFSESHNWYAKSYLAIDQGPEIVMIENYRTGLLWKLFMSCPEVKAGLKKLEFDSPVFSEK